MNKFLEFHTREDTPMTAAAIFANHHTLFHIKLDLVDTWGLSKNSSPVANPIASALIATETADAVPLLAWKDLSVEVTCPFSTFYSCLLWVTQSTTF
jgi:hypothetical protein